jgi:SAM-dependent methyltransferase
VSPSGTMLQSGCSLHWGRQDHPDTMSHNGECCLQRSPYRRADLALVHHKRFSFHPEACAPGILTLLKPIRERRGLVLEIGCGSGLLTKELVDAGHRVIATDASPPMLARSTAPGVEEFALLTLPDEPVPFADAIIGVGHALNYLPTTEHIIQATRLLARSLRPDGVIAFDICDLAWGPAHTVPDNLGRVGDDWAIISLARSLCARNDGIRNEQTEAGVGMTNAMTSFSSIHRSW